MSIQITPALPFTPAFEYPEVDIRFRVSHRSMPVTQTQAIGRVCVLDVGTTGLDPKTSNATNLGWMIMDIDQDYCVSGYWGPYLCSFAPGEADTGFVSTRDAGRSEPSVGDTGFASFGGVTNSNARGFGGPVGSETKDGSNCVNGFAGAVGSGFAQSARPGVIGSTPANFLAQIQTCQLIISHNADFDETMLRKTLPSLPDINRLPWACTLRDMPWNDLTKGYAKSNKGGTIRLRALTDLIGLYGYYHLAHDTAEDAFALSWLLSQPHNHKGMLMQHLIRAIEAPKVMITISQKPKRSERDSLYCRGYRLNWTNQLGGTACSGEWKRIIPSKDLSEEQSWLNQVITLPYSITSLETHPVFPTGTATGTGPKAKTPAKDPTSSFGDIC